MSYTYPQLFHEIAHRPSDTLRTEPVGVAITLSLAGLACISAAQSQKHEKIASRAIDSSVAVASTYFTLRYGLGKIRRQLQKRDNDIDYLSQPCAIPLPRYTKRMAAYCGRQAMLTAASIVDRERTSVVPGEPRNHIVEPCQGEVSTVQKVQDAINTMYELESIGTPANESGYPKVLQFPWLPHLLPGGRFWRPSRATERASQI